MRRFATLLCMCISVGFVLASEPAFHKADVRKGEGVYSLLRRYGLRDQTSIDKFYELNNLNPAAHLLVGESYFLPILIYTYDGKSIRSTIGINDWDLAVRIAEFNRALLRSGLRVSTYEESKILWVPYFELSRRKNVVAEEPVTEHKKLTMRVPLFGEDAEEVTVESQELKGKVYYVVSGHGGPDPGAMSKTGGHTLCEDEYAYDVALRLARNLMVHGAIVEVVVQDPNDGIRSEKYLRCDKDELTLGQKQMPLNQLLRLKERTKAINGLYRQYLQEGFKDQTVICIHVDSRGASARQDVFFYYYGESKSGKKIASTLQQTFLQKYQENRTGRNYHGTVSSRSLYVLRHTDPKAVYVELANIQNAGDLKRILPESNRQALANWLCEGLIAVK